jgi:hypothetical protein
MSSAMAMVQPELILEVMLRHFRELPGLYILGAGASAGAAPLGKDFWTAAPIEYVRGGSFPADIPAHAPLTQRMLHSSCGVSIDEIFLGREIRPGTRVYPYREIMQRMPDFYARSHIKHRLSAARFAARPNDNYRVFSQFHPALIANYNHDGLAAHFCGTVHRVIDVHGAIPAAYGAPEMADFLARARDFDLKVADDGLIMGVPESPFDRALAHRLLEIGRFEPNFVAIIGYSFARVGDCYDDKISLDFFRERFRAFRGSIYVVDPHPSELRETIADALKSRSVFGIPVYWNVFAHAALGLLRHPLASPSLAYAHEALLDKHGSGHAFPIDIWST